MTLLSAEMNVVARAAPVAAQPHAAGRGAARDAATRTRCASVPEIEDAPLRPGRPGRLRRSGKERPWPTSSSTAPSARPGKTPEPLEAAPKPSDGDPIFVVQRHSARRLHYDLRLERDGVLLSWALPRGVPLRAGERSLAVHVEDHPMEYADFEGDIPAGQYGAGNVDLWDRGTYELVRERPDGTLTVILHGGKAEGEWALVPAHLDGEERNWLIVRAAKDRPPGRSGSYEPMRARAAKRVPGGDDWAFEIAWDGVRALAPVEGTRAPLRARRRARSSTRAASSCSGASRARCARASACSTASSARSTDAVVYVVFDLLELEAEPLHRRAVVGAPRAPRWRCSTSSVARGAPLALLRRRRRAAHGRARPGARHRGQAPRLALPPGLSQRRLATARIAPSRWPPWPPARRARSARRASTRPRRRSGSRRSRSRTRRAGRSRTARRSGAGRTSGP